LPQEGSRVPVEMEIRKRKKREDGYQKVEKRRGRRRQGGKLCDYGERPLANDPGSATRPPIGERTEAYKFR